MDPKKCALAMALLVMVGILLVVCCVEQAHAQAAGTDAEEEEPTSATKPQMMIGIGSVIVAIIVLKYF